MSWYNLNHNITDQVQFEQTTSEMWVGDLGYAQVDDPNHQNMLSSGVILPSVKMGTWTARLQPLQDHNDHNKSTTEIHITIDHEDDTHFRWEKLPQAAMSDGGMIGIFDLERLRALSPQTLIEYAEETSSQQVFPFGIYVSSFGGSAEIWVSRDNQNQIIAVSWMID